MPGLAGSPSKREISIEPHAFSETENVSAIPENSSQPVKLPLFNPSSNKIFNGMEHHGPQHDEGNGDVQNCDNELRTNSVRSSGHSKVVKKRFFHALAYFNS